MNNVLLLKEFIAHVLNNEMDDYTIDDEFLNVDTHLNGEGPKDVLGPVPPNQPSPSVHIDPYVKGSGTALGGYFVA
jgi:hypothetical protein